MRYVDEIIVHCSATKPEWMSGTTAAAKVREITRWHTDPPRNWSDIGYHVVIDRDGTIAPGRSLQREGAHAKGHNANTIGICLIGGHGSSAADRPEDHYTPAQMRALKREIDRLNNQFGLAMKVNGHNRYAAKACPGFDAAAWWSRVHEGSDLPRASWLQSLVEAILAIFRGTK